VAQPPGDHAVCEDNKIEGGCCQDRARLAGRKRIELHEALSSCFVRAEPSLQAGKYVGALVSGLPKRTGGRSLSMWVAADRVARLSTIKGLRWASCAFFGGGGVCLILGGRDGLLELVSLKLPTHVGIQALMSLA
jgi:hypothetical protein